MDEDDPDADGDDAPRPEDYEDMDEYRAALAADGVTAGYLKMRRSEIGNGGPHDF